MTMIENKGPSLSRRGFLAGTAGLTFAIGFTAKGAHLIATAEAYAAPRDMSAWVKISPDNIVTILTPGAEMGQGSMTGVPVALAEELDADWNKVVLETAPSDPSVYGYKSRGSRSMAIVGSRAVQMYYNDMRMAGAQVRKVLLDNAAAKWKVPVAELSTGPSVVIHKKSGRRMTYGQIAGFSKVPAKLPKVGKDELKKPSAFRIIGKPVARRDIPAKVNGTAQFAMDVRLPGMVYASVVHSPIQNGKPLSWNGDKIAAMKGMIGTVRLKNGVAMVGRDFEAVMAARAALEVKWGKAKAAGYNSVEALENEYAKKALDPKTKAKKIDAHGDINAAFAGAAKTYKSDYRSDYGYHAQMEPLNAVARFSRDGKSVEIWDGTQAPGRAREVVAKAIGFKTEQVIHHQCYMGGGFGRRSFSDYGAEAALIAREAKRPVKLIWTREEDLANGMFRPQSFQHLEAALDSSGKVTGWKHSVIGDGRRLLSGGMKINKYYKIPNQHIIEQSSGHHGVRTKHWRAVAHVFNVYAIEAFIDEMAAAEGMDPLTFRLERMPLTGKARRVFQTVAKMSDWNAKRPEGRALGLSITERSGSLGAGVAEVSLDAKTGKIRVHKAWMAVDGGTIVQPEAARANIESGIMYGLSSVLFERVTIKNGTVEQSNFHDYHVMRMSDTPEEMHIEFVKSDKRPTGLGEIGNPFVAAAVANGVYKLTGKRLYHMPFTPERVLAALKA